MMTILTLHFIAIALAVCPMIFWCGEWKLREVYFREE